MEPSQEHIHQKLTSELNDMSIRIKLWHDPEIARESTEQQNKIIEARQRYPEPHWEEIIELIRKTIDEIDQCKKPFRRY